MPSGLASIAVYDPRRLSRDEFRESFVARQEILNLVLRDLLAITNCEISQRHFLLVGQRGMGKTTLLRRVAMAIQDIPDLSSKLIPLRFREEQYDVRTLRRLWQNSVESAAEHLEEIGSYDLAHHFDALAVELNSSDATDAYTSLSRALEKIGKRPVLLLDNFDMILENISFEEQQRLHHILEQPDGPILVGASTKIIDQHTKKNSPFRGYLHVIRLEPLSSAELISCLRRLALIRGEKGRYVMNIIEAAPQRIKALHNLTGGNPRTLALIYQLLESDETDAVFEDLEALFDHLTPIYKARIEELPEQQRSVFDAIALNWDPVTTSALAKATNLPVTSVSAQVSRLVERGLIALVSHPKASKAFELEERFFNIWYLMRHGNRRTRRRIKWLTAFLTSYYAPSERKQLAKRFLRRQSFSAKDHMYLFAIAEAQEDEALGQALKYQISEELSTRNNRSVSSLFQLDELNPVSLEREALLERLAHSTTNKAGLSPDLGAKLLRLLNISWTEKAAFVDKLASMTLDEIEVFCLLSEREDRRIASYLGQTAYNDLREAVSKHRMKDAIDVANAFACAELSNRGHVVFAAASPHSRSLRKQVTDQMRQQAIDWGLDRQQTLSGEEKILFARVLRDAGRKDEALAMMQSAIDEGFTSSWAYTWLGSLLETHFEKFELAERAYQNAIKADESHGWPWYRLGDLLDRNLSDRDRALTVYRAGLQKVGDDPVLLMRLGNRLALQADSRPEAEALFRKALAGDPYNTRLMVSLANSLRDQDKNPGEAEELYRRALRFSDHSVYVLESFGMFLFVQGQFEEAKSTLERAVKANSDSASAHVALALTHEATADYESARQHYERAIEITGDYKSQRGDEFVWRRYGAILWRQLDDSSSAKVIFETILNNDPAQSSTYVEAAYFFASVPGREREGEELLRKAVSQHPTDSHLRSTLARYQRDVLQDPKESLATLTSAEEVAAHAQLSVEKAYTLFRLGERSEARDEIDKILKLDDRSREAWVGLAYLLEAENDYTAAEAAYRSGMEVYPADSFLIASLADVISKDSTRLAEAEELVRRSLSLSPHSPYAWCTLGEILSGQGKKDEAENAFRTAVRYDSRYGFAWAELARLLIDSFERYEEAELILQKLTSLEPDSIWCLITRGHILSEKLKRYSDARKCYELAVEKSPNEGPWNELGNLLFDAFGEFSAAELCFRNQLRSSDQESHVVAHMNLVWAQLFQGKAGDAKAARTEIHDGDHRVGLHLIDAALAFSEAKFDRATETLLGVLEDPSNSLDEYFSDDLIRLFRFSEITGHSKQLADWLIASELGARIAPAVAAFRAYVFGDSALSDVNPEVSKPAKEILAALRLLKSNSNI